MMYTSMDGISTCASVSSRLSLKQHSPEEPQAVNRNVQLIHAGRVLKEENVPLETLLKHVRSDRRCLDPTPPWS